MNYGRPLASVVFAIVAFGAAPALGQELQYSVIEPDARIASVRQVTEVQTIDRSVLLIRVGAGHFYRASVVPECSMNLYGAGDIAIATRGVPYIDKHSRVIVDGRTCAIEAFDLVGVSVRPG